MHSRHSQANILYCWFHNCFYPLFAQLKLKFKLICETCFGFQPSSVTDELTIETLLMEFWKESEKIKEWLLHQTFHSPTVTFFLVLTMGACLYSALLLRHSSPLSWWFFMFMASCITRDIGSLCWDNTVTLNLAGSPLCLVVWWVCILMFISSCKNITRRFSVVTAVICWLRCCAWW